MASAHAQLFCLLQERSAVTAKIDQLQKELTVPELSHTQNLLISAVFGLWETNGLAPTVDDLIPLISPGSTRKAMYAHFQALKKADFIYLKQTGVTASLIYPTAKACRLFGVPFIEPDVLNPNAARALQFIKDQLAATGSFPSQANINKHLGRNYGSSSDILSTLSKNKFIGRKGGEWTLLDPQ
jgi:hypothetical protein